MAKWVCMGGPFGVDRATHTDTDGAWEARREAAPVA